PPWTPGLDAQDAGAADGWSPGPMDTVGDRVPPPPRACGQAHPRRPPRGTGLAAGPDQPGHAQPGPRLTMAEQQLPSGRLDSPALEPAGGGRWGFQDDPARWPTSTRRSGRARRP